MKALPIKGKKTENQNIQYNLKGCLFEYGLISIPHITNV